MQTAIMLAEAYRDKATQANKEVAAALMEGAREALEWVNGNETNRFAGLVGKIKKALEL